MSWEKLRGPNEYDIGWMPYMPGTPVHQRFRLTVRRVGDTYELFEHYVDGHEQVVSRGTFEECKSAGGGLLDLATGLCTTS